MGLIRLYPFVLLYWGDDGPMKCLFDKFKKIISKEKDEYGNMVIW